MIYEAKIQIKIGRAERGQRGNRNDPLGFSEVIVPLNLLVGAVGE